jgi:hypothetical protein
MKKTLFTLISLILYSQLTVFGQISQGGQPESFNHKNLGNDFDFIQLQSPDLQQLAYEDSLMALSSAPFRSGVLLPAGANLQNSGSWCDVKGGSIWRLRIKAPGAKALDLFYSSFFLPAGAKLFVYNPDKSKILGAYTASNNNEHGNFTNELIEGDELIVELFLPDNAGATPQLNISDIGYYYRGRFPSEKSADACEVNIRCPEGNNWLDEKQGVCRVSIKNGSYLFWCSGSLMNNVRFNCTPYVLLADHCAYYSSYASTSDLTQWKFYFHYEASSCSGTAASGTNTATGCTLKAHDTYGSNNSGSDFYLVQMSTTPPSGWSLYYNGWDRTNTASSSGVSIHHPQGDIMKISTYTTALTTINVGGSGTHWKVYWANTVTNHGVTEEGSSGSPIFNSAGRVVGTLTGGGSYCSTPNSPDYYGKVYYHWASNGTTSSKQLKPWLDPDNTGANNINGTYVCSNSIDESVINTAHFSVFPNPAKNQISISPGKSGEAIKTIMIYNMLGAAVFEQAEMKITEGLFILNTESFENGMYFMTFIMDNILYKGQFIISK